MTQRKLHEPLHRHIHYGLMKSLNEAMIGIKLHHIPRSEESAIEQAKIGEARRNHHEPTWPEILELLRQTYDEVERCQEPYRRF